MADYVPIPQQSVAPDSMQSLSSLLGAAQAAQNLRLGQDTYNSKVQQAAGDASTAQSHATVNAANVNPLIQQQAAQTSTAQTGADSAHADLMAKYQDKSMQIATGLVKDPRMMAGPNYDPQQAAEALTEARNKAIDGGVPEASANRSFGPLFGAVGQPGAIHQALTNALLQSQSAPQQTTAITPSTTFVPTAQGTQPYNNNPIAAPVGPMGSPMSPPNQVVTTPTGRMGTYNPADGSYKEPQAQGSPPPNNPQNETQDSINALQGERNNARTAALQGPQMHDINKTIMQAADNGNVTTGALGAGYQWLRSHTGYSSDDVGNQNATDTQVLGKMLERASAQAAQSMGPHTNAGLESAKAQNGTMDYSLPALKKIAFLNDSLQTGVDNYNTGMEAAIAKAGSVAGKRQFDTQWGQNATVDALKLANAYKLNDPKMKADVTTSLGGANSPQYKAALSNVKNLSILTQQGSLP